MNNSQKEVLTELLKDLANSLKELTKEFLSKCAKELINKSIEFLFEQLLNYFKKTSLS